MGQMRSPLVFVRRILGLKGLTSTITCMYVTVLEVIAIHIFSSSRRRSHKGEINISVIIVCMGKTVRIRERQEQSASDRVDQ